MGEEALTVELQPRIFNRKFYNQVLLNGWGNETENFVFNRKVVPSLEILDDINSVYKKSTV